MKSWFRGFAGLLLASVATVASAEFHTYVIEQLFSNASGTVQFIVMHESQGMSAEYFWQGNQITSTSLGQTQRYTFPTNLQIGAMCNPYPYGCPAAVPTSTANTRVLIATQGFADLQIVTPDYRGSQRVSLHQRRHGQLRRRRSDDLCLVAYRRYNGA